MTTPENTKLAAQIPGLLHESSELMSKLASDNEELLDENEALRHKVAVMELVDQMTERGLEPTLSRQEKIAALMPQSPAQIEKISNAIEFAAAGISLGRVATTDDLPQGTKTSGQIYSPGKEDPLDTMVLGLSGFTNDQAFG